MSRAHQTAFLYLDPMLSYGRVPPFSPSADYPEYPFRDSVSCGAANPSYEAVRRFLRLAQMDSEHFDSPSWNPLGNLIRPGQTVMIKPNLVLHENHSGNTLECVYTHASLIRAMLDYVYIALRGSGRVIVGDAPLQSCRFMELCEISGLSKVVQFYRDHASVAVELTDFRQEQAMTDRSGQIMGVSGASGDPQGYAVVDLANRSMLAPICGRFKTFRVTNYDPALMSQHHNLERNEYLISQSVLSADVLISMPKMKTHRKAGITGALKNFVGINGHKDWLPHHSKGSRQNGGDEYLRASLCKALGDFAVEREDVSSSKAVKKSLRPIRCLLYRAGRFLTRDKYMEGSWWGNDTIWRTVLDLNRIALYADKTGVIREKPQRRLFFLVDGILAGECEGPVAPDPKTAGVLIGGVCAATVDAVMARVMGFDYRKIPSIREAFGVTQLPIAPFMAREIEIRTNSREYSAIQLDEAGISLQFKSTKGWEGHIELRGASQTNSRESPSDAA